MTNKSKAHFGSTEMCGEIQFIFVFPQYISWVYFQPSVSKQNKTKHHYLYATYHLLPQVKHPDQQVEYGRKKKISPWVNDFGPVT